MHVWASEVIDTLGKMLKVYGGGCGLWHGRMNDMITLEIWVIYQMSHKKYIAY